jgi:SSS family solute:Na+ symporter
VLDIVYFAYSLRGSLFVIVLLGIYWKKTSQKGAICGIICTGVVGHFPIHPAITETYAAVVTAFVTTVIFTMIFPKEKAAK